MIGRGAKDGVYRFLLLQHHAEILVGGGLIVRSLVGVVRLDFLFYGQTTGDPFKIERSEVLPLNGIGHGDDLRIVLHEKGAGVGAALATAADDGYIHLLARRNKPRSAQDMA